jgi:regulator of sigma D
LYFRARQQLIEKEQELQKLKKAVDDKNAKLQAKKIQAKKLENFENEKIDYNRLGDFENYLKIEKLKNVTCDEKKLQGEKLNQKTKNLMKSIPQSVLNSFHVPKYLRS